MGDWAKMLSLGAESLAQTPASSGSSQNDLEQVPVWWLCSFWSYSAILRCLEGGMNRNISATKLIWFFSLPTFLNSVYYPQIKLLSVVIICNRSLLFGSFQSQTFLITEAGNEPVWPLPTTAAEDNDTSNAKDWQACLCYLRIKMVTVLVFCIKQKTCLCSSFF